MKFAVDSLLGNYNDCVSYKGGVITLELSIGAMHSDSIGWKMTGQGLVEKKKGDYFLKAKAKNHKILNFSIFD